MKTSIPDDNDEKYHTMLLAHQICQMALLLDLGLPADMIMRMHRETMDLLLDAALLFVEEQEGDLKA